LSSTYSTTSLTRVSGWRKQWDDVWHHLRNNPIVLAGTVVVLVWCLIGVAAPLIAPYDPLAQNTKNVRQPPSVINIMGTDELGRDILSRVAYGARITIPAGLLTITFGALVGVVVGAIAGYFGGIADEIIMRITELFMAFPTIVLAMAVTAALGPDVNNAVLALVIVWWPSYARMIRGLVLDVKSREFVEATRSAGASGFYILTRTILPNCIAPALILATLDIGNAILTFAGLSFLGLGAAPERAEWGRMVSLGIESFGRWWVWLYPGIAIASLVMAFNFIGDGLRDLLDPRLRR
jgi:peptide/nickel transport system permease protein